MTRVIVLAISVLLVVVGCGGPTARVEVIPAPAPRTEPVQRGMVLPTWERHGYQDQSTGEALKDIADVGANWVQIVPTWYQPAPNATTIAPTASTVDDADVRRVVSLARAQGLRVLLKPHVDVLDGTDRARINPADRDAWFASYREFITHYASLAAQLDVDQFAVGTELAGLSTDRSHWLPVIGAVRRAYGGEVLYAANHDEYKQVAFWEAVDLVGIDAYWPLSAQRPADAAELTAALMTRRDELAAFAARVNHRILFTEAGFASQAGTASAPWSGDVSKQVAKDEQAAAYDALLTAFTGQPWWAGVFFWMWAVSAEHGVLRPTALDHAIWGKPAEAVVQKWWKPSLGARADGPAR